MSNDIELPAVDDFLPAEKRWTTANFLACTEAYARAAILADREKRAQAAQGEVAAYQYLFDGIYGEVWRNSSEIWNGQKPKASRPLYDHPATEASKPVQAEAPTASNAELEASYTATTLAAMILSDCGHSTENTRLLERVAKRIDKYADTIGDARAALATQPTASNAGGWVRGHMGSTPDGGIDDHDEPADQEPNLVRAVDDWFAQNTGLGGCSNKDVAELAAIFYGVTFEGGRESVDDALAIVDSFGPGIEGLNDTYARQVLLAQEVRRLHADYIKAVQGRQEWRDAAIRARLGGQIEANLRKALRLARDHIDMNALRVSHCKDAEAIDNALAGRVPE